jgi:hypothetical protein
MLFLCHEERKTEKNREFQRIMEKDREGVLKTAPGKEGSR